MDLKGSRRGLSKLALPVAIIAIVAAAGAYVFVTNAPATSTTTSVSSAPTMPVRTAVNHLVQNITARNVDGVVSFYAPNSVVVWSGSTGGLVGKYTGPTSVRLIYAASVGKTTKIGANVSSYSENVFSPTHINSTYLLLIAGNSTVLGDLNASVNVSEEWNWGAAGWQIIRENWAYRAFSASLLSAGYGSSTTFPQWGYMQKGGNPDLVSEKSFEWHAGPYLAVALYAMLFSIALSLAVRRLARGRLLRARGRSKSPVA
jgi:hypothetical protein